MTDLRAFPQYRSDRRGQWTELCCAKTPHRGDYRRRFRSGLSQAWDRQWHAADHEIVQGKRLHGNCRLLDAEHDKHQQTSIVTGVPPVVHGINGNYYLDSETGKEIMITDAKRLRCGTILGALSHAGVKTAVVTAKDKLLKVLAYEMEGIDFSSEYAGKANLRDNGIENVGSWSAGQPRTSTPRICRCSCSMPA